MSKNIKKTIQKFISTQKLTPKQMGDLETAIRLKSRLKKQVKETDEVIKGLQSKEKWFESELEVVSKIDELIVMGYERLDPKWQISYCMGWPVILDSKIEIDAYWGLMQLIDSEAGRTLLEEDLDGVKFEYDAAQEEMIMNYVENGKKMGTGDGAGIKWMAQDLVRCYNKEVSAILNAKYKDFKRKGVEDDTIEIPSIIREYHRMEKKAQDMTKSLLFKFTSLDKDWTKLEEMFKPCE